MGNAVISTSGNGILILYNLHIWRYQSSFMVLQFWKYFQNWDIVLVLCTPIIPP